MKYKNFIKRVLGIFIGFNLLNTASFVFASSVDIVFSDKCDSVIIDNIDTDISSNIIGIQVNIEVESDVTSKIENIEFKETSGTHTGFATYNEDTSSISINLASDTDLRGETGNQTSYIDLGDLEIDGVSFSELIGNSSIGSITIIDFLYNQKIIDNLDVKIANIDDILNPDNTSGNNNNSNSSSSSGSSSNNNSNSNSDYDEENANDDTHTGSSSTSSTNNSNSTDSDEKSEEFEQDLEYNVEDEGIKNSIYLEKLTTSEINGILNSFVDMEDTWAREVVAYCIKHNFFAGVSENEFAPNDNMTRAMFVTVLSRVEGVSEYEYNSKFSDVPNNEWYSKAVSWCVENGVTSGVGDGLFGTHDNITREQMAVLLYNYVNKFGIKLNFKDTKTIFNDENLISDYAVEAVNIMAYAGILNGKGDGEFDPKGQATRAEVAAMLYGFLNNIYL